MTEAAEAAGTAGMTGTAGTAGGTDEEIAALGRRWAQAEQSGDVRALEELLTADFRGVGPQGFVLDRPRWLARYTSGDLVHDAFTWCQAEVHRYGGAAVVIGVQSQQSIYNGRDLDGHFRGTQFLTMDGEGRWRLAGVHLSAIATAPAELALPHEQ